MAGALLAPGVIRDFASCNACPVVPSVAAGTATAAAAAASVREGPGDPLPEEGLLAYRARAGELRRWEQQREKARVAHPMSGAARDAAAGRG